jgi:hypothetical protein
VAYNILVSARRTTDLSRRKFRGFAALFLRIALVLCLLGASMSACSETGVAVKALAPIAKLRLELDPPDASGVTLAVRNGQGAELIPAASVVKAGLLEVTLDAPGTYTITVSLGGKVVTTLGPLSVAPGATSQVNVALTGSSSAPPAVRTIVGDFSAGAWAGWQNFTYFPWSRKNDYRRETGADGEPIVHVSSDSAGSMFIHPANLRVDRTPVARWRWKVPGPIATADERQNETDDAAARVYFVWGATGTTNLTNAEALCYIWGRTRRPGEIGPSPFSPKEGVFCLRAGHTGAGVWQDEQRDVEADFRAYFKKAPPGPLTAVAIMTDTDNTKSTAEAWYGPITLEARPQALSVRGVNQP